MVDLQGRQGAENGMKIIKDVNTHLLINFYLLKPREDTVIDICTGVDSDGDAVDFKDIGNWVGTVKENDLLAIPLNHKITAIKLTSGSIQCF